MMGLWNKLKSKYNHWKIRRLLKKNSDEGYNYNPQNIIINNNTKITSPNEWKNKFSRGWDKQDGSVERYKWQ